MVNEKETIREWLKKIGKDRNWLAEKCLISKPSVDNWFRSNGVIPHSKLIQIRELMSRKSFDSEYKTSKVEVTVSFYEKEWEIVQQYADKRGISVERLIEECVIEMTKKLKDRDLWSIQHQPENPTSIIGIGSVHSHITGKVIGNIAAGDLWAGDTIPYDVEIHRPLEKGEYILRVEGHSMEPEIEDGSLVIMRKYTTPPVPPVGTIVEYYDERGVTLKRLGVRDVDGKPEYVLHAINPDFPEITPMEGGCISAIYVETIK